MLQIVVHDPHFAVQILHDQGGNEITLLRMQDQISGIAIETPFSEESKRQLIQALNGQQPVQVAKTMPQIEIAR